MGSHRQASQQSRGQARVKHAIIVVVCHECCQIICTQWQYYTSTSKGQLREGGGGRGLGLQLVHDSDSEWMTDSGPVLLFLTNVAGVTLSIVVGVLLLGVHDSSAVVLVIPLLTPFTEKN
jgi:hypothetical protein